MRPPEELLTHRLALRPLTEKDTAFVSSYAQDPEVTRFLSFRRHTAPEQGAEFVQRCISAWRAGAAFTWIIGLRESGAAAGAIELRPGPHGLGVGYVLHRPYWGNGYMTEAVSTLRKWSLEQPDVFRFWAFCDAENLASARVLEKAGLAREGLLRRWAPAPNIGPEPRDCFCYAAVRP